MEFPFCTFVRIEVTASIRLRGINSQKTVKFWKDQKNETDAKTVNALI
jgi:hypothetical protein